MNSSKDKHTVTKRKSEHLDLTFKSQIDKNMSDKRFMYEPMLGNVDNIDLSKDFLGTKFGAPIWVSSMTGGTESAAVINKNLAKLSLKFGLGMGLGSCRQLLEDNSHFSDFDIRKYIGNRPLYANLGIAQVEQLIEFGQVKKIEELVKKLSADGLILHINPLQEFTQPEGDKLKEKPIDTLKRLMDKIDINIIVKEVGQGMGINSLKVLLQLPLVAVDFASFGGTNFAKLELLRNKNLALEQYASLVKIGHSTEEMVGYVNVVKKELGNKLLCKEIIVSGGIKNFLDGYYYTEKVDFSAIYGMASGLLRFATGDYDLLEEYMFKHIEGLKIANAFLKIKKY